MTGSRLKPLCGRVVKRYDVVGFRQKQMQYQQGKLCTGAFHHVRGRASSNVGATALPD